MNQPQPDSRRSLVESLRQDPAIPKLTEAEWAALEAALPEVVESARRWCAPLVLRNQGAVLPISLISIISLVNVQSVQAALARVKNTMWIYALDDAMDDLAQPENEVENLAHDCILAAQGVGSDRPTVIGEAMRSLIREFSGYPNFHAFRETWERTLLSLLAGMQFERALSRRAIDGRHGIPMSLDAYLNHAVATIGLDHVFVGGLFVDPETRNTESLADLLQLARPCSVAMRLANDLAGFTREDAAGELNAVSILAHELAEVKSAPGESTLASARDVARTRLLAALKEARTCATELHSPTGVEWRILRATHVAIELYLAIDLREWDVETGSVRR
jgi:hypothetical protein